MAHIQLVRHATLLVDLGETTFLVDPMLSEAGAMDPIQNAANDRRNPLVELPALDLDWDALLVTHLHRDHLDDAARETLPVDRPVFCQPEDEADLAETFADVRPVDDEARFDGVRLVRTPARHGHGDLAAQMGPVSGFVLEEADGPTSYLAGDTVWYDGVATTLDAFDPDVVVVNAGAAQFTTGRPITMTAADVIRTCEHTDATVVVDHMEAINHCLLERDELRVAVDEAGCGDQVVIPADGEVVEIE